MIEKENNLSGGGSATNSGIDYQQRVGAWFLVSHYTGFELSKTIDIERETIIESIHFETQDSVDDLKIICKDLSIYCQIKRRITSLSESRTSDFNKALNQFITSYINNFSVNNIYVLITTSESTSKVKKDLKKILTSIRLNDTSFSQNPLNKSEENTSKAFRTQFYHMYLKITGNKTDEENFINFCKQLFITIIDLEEGSSNISAALMLLKSKGFSNPELIWKLLISNCITFAAKRQSINKKYIDDLLNQYTVASENEEGNFKLDSKNNISCDKDIILISSFLEDADFMIVELFRFDDIGMPKLIYRDNKLIIEGKDETTEWNVLFRSATIAGMMRHIDENKTQYESKKFLTIETHEDIDHVEELPHVIAYKEKYKNELNQNLKKWCCLHCGKSISSDMAYLVEIDEIGLKHAIGPIHQDCHRRLDRVLGTSGLKNPLPKSHIKNFDYKKWISLIVRGQGQVQAIKSYDYGDKKPIISYNFEREINDGAYCIRITLEDKTYSYLYCGHEIERYAKDEGEYMLAHLRRELSDMQKANDPINVSSRNYNRGKYSDLVKRKKSDEKLIKVREYDLIKYSEMLSKINETIENDYAPICILYDNKSQELIEFSNIIPIISDPFRFDNFYENWKQSGFIISDCELKIIESDKEFGLNLLKFFEKEQQVIIDPEFDLNQNLIKGFPIVKHQDFIEKKKVKASDNALRGVENPRFLKGEKVKIVFPEIKQDKYPEGILLENELENEQGERFVVFQPVENGVNLELMCSVPSTLIKKN